MTLKMFNVHYFEKVDSTNIKAKSFKENSVIVAEEQTKGKGRFERIWFSSKGGLYLSLVLGAKDANYLTFIGAISVNKAIKEVYGLNTTVKWPNDLLYKKKKVCGILTEIKRDKVIVGIGINTNNIIPKSLENKAVSLNKIIDKKIDNKRLLTNILEIFEYYLKLLENKKYSKIINDWKKNSFLGSKVKVKTLTKTYSGIAFDIDKDCFLIIKDKNNNKIKILEGDVLVK